MSESNSRPLKIALSKTDLNGKYGDDVEFTADLSTVKDAITGGVGAIGLGNCLKLGEGAVAATALYVLVRSIQKNWRWLKTTNVEKDVLEVSVPPKKENQFTELMKKNILEQRLVQDFENLNISLEGILGEETFEQCGEDVLKLLKDIRIKSIGQIGDDDIVAVNVVQGVHKVKNFGHKAAALRGGTTAVPGTVAVNFVAPGATMEGENHGGIALAAKDLTPEGIEKALNALQGNAIKVKIRGEMLNGTFVDKFDATMTIEEVCETIQKREKLTKRITLTRKDGELTDEMTLAEAEGKGSLVKLKAKIFDEKN